MTPYMGLAAVAATKAQKSSDRQTGFKFGRLLFRYMDIRNQLHFRYDQSKPGSSACTEVDKRLKGALHCA